MLDPAVTLQAFGRNSLDFINKYVQYINTLLTPSPLHFRKWAWTLWNQKVNDTVNRSKLETHQADEELLNSNNRLWASPYWSILVTIMTTSVLQGSVRYVDWCTRTLKNVSKTFSFRLLLSNLIVKTTELHKQIISWTAGDLSKMRQLTSRHENSMSLCDTTSYEVQTFKGNDPFKRSIAIQSFWNMDEMKRVKETSPFARVAQ